MSLIVITLSVVSLVGALKIAAGCLQRPGRTPFSHRTSARKSRFGYYPSAAANALQTIQAIVHPQTQHVIATVCDGQFDEDDCGDPTNPLQHLHRQAARIRRGEPIDHLTALLPLTEVATPPVEVGSC